ncbi:hypothetical protein [Thermoflavimicrobium dichotomicum]|uniref:Uncharacterized protein n=1 Tax=Thermoflavimicrobium dichotomicum TaxID=46223 RepID=A0A1I3M052_9BACL|nr:hypothetical protein [Thermoflavimicrobium dichotomicum]SFI90307.1 hypothetical protein SAMN05421852_102391 [Thermoflavimicrobium dichotomicum]
MKKYHYSSYGNNVIPFDSHHSSTPISNIYQSNEATKWGYILEEQANEYHKVESLLLDKYKNSFNKKRLIKIWEKNRTQVSIAPLLPSIIEKVIYQNVYEDIKGLIFTCYHEDFDLPYVEITLHNWLQQLNSVAKELDREWDAIYWQEMIDFFKQCKKFDLLDFEQTIHTTKNY